MNNPEFVYNEYIVQNKTTVQLAEEWQLPKSTVYNITKKLGLVGTKLADKVTYCNENKFSVNDEIFCYLAGLISADGYIDEKNHRVTLRMNIDAKEILEKLHDYFEVSNPVVPYSGTGGYTQGYTMYDLTISSKKLLDELRKLNIYGRKKDLLVRFPNMSKLNDTQQEMYMRGLWDGDGTSYTNKRITDILEESQLMISAIGKFLKIKLNIDCYYDINNKGFPRLSIRTNDWYIFYEWLYRHNLNCCIKYKYTNYLNNK